MTHSPNIVRLDAVAAKTCDRRAIDIRQNDTMADLVQGLRILVIDDDDDSREFLSVALEGADVTGVASVREAIAVIMQQDLDIILSDIQMPEQDGYELIRKVKDLEIKQGRQIPAIAVTAFAREQDRIQSQLEGFQQHLTKPIDLDELIAAIMSLTGRSQQP